MSEKVGSECKLFVGAAGATGYQGAATEVTKVKDNELPLKAKEIDNSSREDGGWENWRQGLKGWGADFEMKYDPSDAAWQLIHDAFFSGNKIGCKILDGPQDTGAGVQGLVVVTEFTRSEPKDGMVTNKVTFKGCGKPTGVGAGFQGS